jgi:hypothetical protein
VEEEEEQKEEEQEEEHEEEEEEEEEEEQEQEQQQEEEQVQEQEQAQRSAVISVKQRVRTVKKRAAQSAAQSAEHIQQHILGCGGGWWCGGWWRRGGWRRRGGRRRRGGWRRSTYGCRGGGAGWPHRYPRLHQLVEVNGSHAGDWVVTGGAVKAVGWAAVCRSVEATGGAVVGTRGDVVESWKKQGGKKQTHEMEHARRRRGGWREGGGRGRERPILE